MPYIFIGFAFGFAIPYLARRFSKFMPATFACALYPTKLFQKKKEKTTTNTICYATDTLCVRWDGE